MRTGIVPSTYRIEQRAPQFWVYVVELKDGALGRGDGIQFGGAMYVGETSKPPAERFEDHLAGHRAASIVRRFGERILDERTRGPFVTRDQALLNERELAQELREQGFKVWGGQGDRLMRKACAFCRRNITWVRTAYGDRRLRVHAGWVHVDDESTWGCWPEPHEARPNPSWRSFRRGRNGSGRVVRGGSCSGR